MLPLSLEMFIVNPMKKNRIKNNNMKEQELKKDHLLPVQTVSIYHYILRAPVRLYHKKGKLNTYEMF